MPGELPTLAPSSFGDYETYQISINNMLLHIIDSYFIGCCTKNEWNIFPVYGNDFSFRLINLVNYLDRFPNIGLFLHSDIKPASLGIPLYSGNVGYICILWWFLYWYSQIKEAGLN